MSKFKCSVCNKPSNTEQCFLHKPKKTLKKTNIKIKEKSNEQKIEKKENSDKMNMFWMYCWENLPQYSEISKWKFKDCNKMHYHHLLPKNTHPELKFSIGNILCVTQNEHTIIENDLDTFSVVKKRITEVKKNYDELVKQGREWEQEYNKLIKKKQKNGK